MTELLVQKASYLYFYVSLYVSFILTFLMCCLLTAPKESEKVEDYLKSIIAKMTPTLIFQGQDDFIF